MMVPEDGDRTDTDEKAGGVKTAASLVNPQALQEAESGCPGDILRVSTDPWSKTAFTACSDQSHAL
ncbi:hypothetical protein [Chthonobacter rhizosphaerae]|uniref:hypothetical protein n=1 Tax=Chthonobacter rhizosphaerae TaxID=2735553 RepID=UPI0015EE7572|nr:hypothetical protein [Chthonobacter rhizosphaerae]